MSDAIDVVLREERGTRASRRLRSQGKVPAILYGHGEESISLTVKVDQIEAALRHHSQVVDLKGAQNDTALIKEIQWDTFGQSILHLDLIRVRKGEKIETEVPVELRGDAPGSHEGGIVQHLLHELTIECPAEQIPDRIEVNVNELNVGDSIALKDLEMPENVKALHDEEEVVVQCVDAAMLAPVEEEEVEAEPTSLEPEIIRREKEEEAENE